MRISIACFHVSLQQIINKKTTNVKGYLPSSTYQYIQSNLAQLGDEAISPQTREWSADAERHQPYVKGYNVWGQRYDYDRLITSEGWKQLSRWGARHGYFFCSFPYVQN
jgi:hypothetical protein